MRINERIEKVGLIGEEKQLGEWWWSNLLEGVAANMFSLAVLEVITILDHTNWNMILVPALNSAEHFHNQPQTWSCWLIRQHCDNNMQADGESGWAICRALTYFSISTVCSCLREEKKERDQKLRKGWGLHHLRPPVASPCPCSSLPHQLWDAAEIRDSLNHVNGPLFICLKAGPLCSHFPPPPRPMIKKIL